MWGDILALSSVCLAMCLFEIVVFEVNAFLKWMHLQSKFKSGTCITKNKQTKTKKHNYQGLHYKRPTLMI